MKWVYAAYGAAWAIHIVYLAILTRGYQRLRDDIDDLNRSYSERMEYGGDSLTLLGVKIRVQARGRGPSAYDGPFDGIAVGVDVPGHEFPQGNRQPWSPLCYDGAFDHLELVSGEPERPIT
jgi:hypothetical protein